MLKKWEKKKKKKKKNPVCRYLIEYNVLYLICHLRGSFLNIFILYYFILFFFMLKY